MADSTPRRPRRLIRVVVAVLGVLVLAGAVLWEFLPAIVEHVAIARLADMGIPAPALTVRRIGLESATLTGIELGEDDELSAREILVDYTLPELFDGKIEAITIRGASVQASVGPDGLSFGSLDSLLSGGEDAASPALPPIQLEDARLALATQLGEVEVTGGGTVASGQDGIVATLDIVATAPQGTATGAVDVRMKNGVIDATLRLANSALSLPGLLRITATGDASLRIADGEIGDLSGALALSDLMVDVPRAAGLGPLQGTLIFGRESEVWHADLALDDAAESVATNLRLSAPARDPGGAVTTALDLDAQATAPIWPLLGLPAPSAGRVRISVLTEIKPSDVLAAIDLSSLPTLAGSMTLEIDDAAYPGVIDMVSAVGGFDIVLHEHSVRLTGPAPLLADVSLAAELLRRTGLSADAITSLSGPMAVTLTLAEPVSIDLKPDGTAATGKLDATVDLAGGNRLLGLTAAGTAFISGSGDLSYDLPAFDAEMALPEGLAKELKVPDGRIAAAGHASGSVGHDADAALTLEASASRFAALGFDAHDPSGHLPLAISFAGGQLRVKLTGQGAIEAKRQAGPTPLTLDGAVRLPLQAAEAPVLTVDLRPADGPLATLDLTGGPLRLSGSIGTEDGPVPGEISLPRMRLTGSYDGAGWSGKLRAGNGAFTLPSYAVGATEIALSVDVAAGAAPQIALSAALAHHGDPPYVIPLTARIAAHEMKNGWAFSGTAKDASDRISLAIDGRHDLARGTGSATLKLAPIELIPNVRQPEDFAPWLAGFADEVSGTVALAGDVSWDSEVISSKLELLIRDLSATTDAAVFERVNGVIELDGLSPFTTPPGQKVAVALIDAGIPLTDGLLTFRIAPGPKLEIAGGTLHLAGGKVDAEPLTLDPTASRSEGVLLVEGVDLGELLALAGVDGLTGEGRMSGRIPVAIENNDVIIAGGVLDAEAPGVLSYAPLAPPAALQGQGETVSLALSALTNFQYQALRLTVDRQAGGEMVVGMHVTGSNPDFYDGYPVEFNLNVSGALDRVLRQGLAGYRIPETIQERLEEFAR
jgi:hypothetical protein